MSILTTDSTLPHRFPTSMIKSMGKAKSEEDGEHDKDDSFRRFLVKSKGQQAASKAGGDYQLIYHHSSSPQLNTIRRTKVSRDSSLSNLKINEIVSTDFYSFESSARGESGESSNYHTANEFETAAEYGPKFIKFLESLTYQENEPATLECRVTAKPRPTVHWYKAGIDESNVLIKDCADFIYLEEDNDVYKLVIREVNAKDSSVYKVLLICESVCLILMCVYCLLE